MWIDNTSDDNSSNTSNITTRLSVPANTELYHPGIMTTTEYSSNYNTSKLFKNGSEIEINYPNKTKVTSDSFKLLNIINNKYYLCKKVNTMTRKRVRSKLSNFGFVGNHWKIEKNDVYLKIFGRHLYSLFGSSLYVYNTETKRMLRRVNLQPICPVEVRSVAPVGQRHLAVLCSNYGLYLMTNELGHIRKHGHIYFDINAKDDILYALRWDLRTIAVICIDDTIKSEELKSIRLFHPFQHDTKIFFGEGDQIILLSPKQMHISMLSQLGHIQNQFDCKYTYLYI